MKRLAVIYICTGGYKVFWKDFYSSSEQFFLNEYEKTYFVFTDSNEIILNRNDKVKTYYTKQMGWPYDTLERWSDICRVQDLLLEYDYVAFCNANTQFIKQFNIADMDNKSIILWTQTKEGTSQVNMPFESDERSRAAVPNDIQTKYYYNGGFFIGKSQELIKMAVTLRDWTEEDLRNGIIACHHDESMLNSYVYHYKDTVFSRIGSKEFIPEEFMDSSNTPCAIFRNKDKYGGNIGIRYNNKMLGNADIMRRRILNKIKKICGQ